MKNELDSIIKKHNGSLTNTIEDIGLNIKNPNKRMDLYVDILGQVAEDSSTIRTLYSEMKYARIEIAEQKNKLAIADSGMADYIKELEKMSITDELTGLYNRRFFNAILSKEIARANRGYNASLIIADIDNFKSFNDNYGHLAGDKVLSVMGKFLKNEIRESDSACRYGGEEFGIILPDTNKKYALDMAYRLNRGLAHYPIEFEDENRNMHNLPISISVGVDQIKKEESIRNLVDRIDKLLYNAKSSGRNCVVGKDGIYNPKN